MNAIMRMGLCGVLALGCLPAAGQSNYCYNGSFNSSKGPLDGWNLNYDWTENSKQIGNHKLASYLPEFKGRKNVLKMAVPGGYESKVETALIAYQPGDRYKCTFDLYTEKVGLRVLFLGYSLRPGIAPGDEPKLQDLRRVYKGDAGEGGGASWKPVSVAFPHEQISELAYSHLKKIRYITVLMYVPGGTLPDPGVFYLANVKIEKLSGKCKVTKRAAKSSDE